MKAVRGQGPGDTHKPSGNRKAFEKKVPEKCGSRHDRDIWGRGHCGQLGTKQWETVKRGAWGHGGRVAAGPRAAHGAVRTGQKYDWVRDSRTFEFTDSRKWIGSACVHQSAETT